MGSEGSTHEAVGVLLSHDTGAEGHEDSCSIPGTWVLVGPARLAAVLVLPGGVCWGMFVPCAGARLSPMLGTGRWLSSPALQGMLQIWSDKRGVQRGGGFILKIKRLQPEPRRRTQQEEGDDQGNEGLFWGPGAPRSQQPPMPCGLGVWGG